MCLGFAGSAARIHPGASIVMLTWLTRLVSPHLPVHPPPPQWLIPQCLPCPQGAYCDGGFAPPVALTGWYNLDGSGPEECPPERLARPVCDYVVPCEPKEACTGNNTCATGYDLPL